MSIRSYMSAPGRQAAKPETLEDDQEITITFKLRTHGSTDTANGFIQYLKRQLSVMTHRDVELLDYSVKLPEIPSKKVIDDD